VAIDGSKFKAVNNRDKNFTRAKVERRWAQIEESVGRYLQQLDTADRQEPSDALAARTTGAEHPGHPATDGRPQGIGAGLCSCHQACDTPDPRLRDYGSFIPSTISQSALAHDGEGLWSVESRDLPSAKAF
jgi:hypothetical protein